MSTFLTTVIYFLIAATFQNIVLTTGLGSAAMLRMLRRPRMLVAFGGLLLLFSVLTTALFHPIDHLLPVTWVFLMLRPFIIIVLTSLLYVVAMLLTSRRFPHWYKRWRHLLPLAALNNLVIGIALVINYQASLTFFPAIGLSAGSAVGFLALSALTAEGMSRIDNPDTPASFRGLPATLVYLGLLALALMGFNPLLNLI